MRSAWPRSDHPPFPPCSVSVTKGKFYFIVVSGGAGGDYQLSLTHNIGIAGSWHGFPIALPSLLSVKYNGSTSNFSDVALSTCNDATNYPTPDKGDGPDVVRAGRPPIKRAGQGVHAPGGTLRSSTGVCSPPLARLH